VPEEMGQVLPKNRLGAGTSHAFIEAPMHTQACHACVLTHTHRDTNTHMNTYAHTRDICTYTHTHEYTCVHTGGVQQLPKMANGVQLQPRSTSWPLAFDKRSARDAAVSSHHGPPCMVGARLGSKMERGRGSLSKGWRDKFLGVRCAWSGSEP
jgi:hypothetical protein